MRATPFLLSPDHFALTREKAKKENIRSRDFFLRKLNYYEKKAVIFLISNRI